MNEKVEWWQKYLRKIGFPEYGHFMIVPEEEPTWILLMHGESMRSIGVSLDDVAGETLEDCAAFFRQVLPKGEVAAPARLTGDGKNGS